MAKIAVIGAGISGLTAAYVLRRSHEVVLLESEDRLGGHAHTHQVGPLAVDSGFIVHNDRTYPYLRKLFSELDVEVAPTEMSMSITCHECGLSYAGGKGPSGILAQPSALLKPRFLGLLREVPRFQKLALQLLESPDDQVTLGAWLRKNGFSEYFSTHYAQSIVACVWSSGHERSFDYPARYLFEFLAHHGLLKFRDAPQWYTVRGGSREYVSKVAAQLDDVRVGSPARGVLREDGGVRINLDDGHLDVDKVVIATHADQALRLLDDPSRAEKDVLGAFEYTTNETVLHTDESFLPSLSRARSSWNYRMASCSPSDEQPEVNYWMNHLQSLPGSTQHIVSLNPSTPIEQSRVTARMFYEHPSYTPESVAAQKQLPSVASETTVYAGAYHGWGFHEDGCRSGVEAARHFGVTW